MADEPDDLDLLTTVSTEVEAAVITNALQQLGIEAVEAGGYTSGFKAEAPGAVKVFVKRVVAELVRRALHQIRDEQADIDWLQVDVGGAALPACDAIRTA